MTGAKLFIYFISDEEEQRMKNAIGIERARLLNKKILMIYNSKDKIIKKGAIFFDQLEEKLKEFI
jgi:hypothetical protein